MPNETGNRRLKAAVINQRPSLQDQSIIVSD